MEEDALVGRADGQRHAHLRGLPAVDVAQPEDDLLGRRERPTASRTRSIVSRAITRSSGQGSGGRAQWSGWRGWSAGRNRSRATSGPSSSARAESGSWRSSRAARVLARLQRMAKIHVFRDERPANAPIPSSTASHVSWTTSSTTAELAMKARATRTSAA